MRPFFWIKCFLFFALYCSPQLSVAAVVLDSFDKQDLGGFTFEKQAQNNIYAFSDRINVIWENTVPSSRDYNFKLPYNLSKVRIQFLKVEDNQNTSVYFTSHDFIVLKLDSHKIAYHFHSFP